MAVTGQRELGSAVHHPPPENGAGDGVVDPAHALHAVRGQADLVTGYAVVADDRSDIGVLYFVGGGKVRQSLDRHELRVVPMAAHQRLSRTNDIECHVRSLHFRSTIRSPIAGPVLS
ncbi:hypothetical protein EOD04_08765 [Mesorhizobium sp. M2C.T.Ca.TU.009.01.2.1]|nr:hypothetical protein EOD04_08765 [Mesorhizobium sp. M2C.T.Ca.TU.009.01.2.1]